MNRFGLWIGRRPLLLASASRIRCELIESAGIPVEAQAAALDERAAEARLADRSPKGVARGLAEAKALAVSRLQRGRIVLGADQTLALDNSELHKPKDRDEARRHLVSLSGRAHHLHSGLALAENGAIVWSHVDSAALHMRPLVAAFIEAYLDAAGDDVFSSVGAYRLEAHGAHLFERVEGDHTTILGLPLAPLLAELRRKGCLVA